MVLVTLAVKEANVKVTDYQKRLLLPGKKCQKHL